jgi:hypothetical protein
MATSVQLGDRREYLRLNSAGEFWVSLRRVEQVVVRNLSLRGALIEVPAGLQYMRIAHIALQDHGPVVDAVVRHASPASDAPEEDRFLVGLEFVNLSEAARANLIRMVDDGDFAPG